MTTAQGRPWDQADTGGITELVHLALFFAVEEVVVVLHRDEFGPVISG